MRYFPRFTFASVAFCGLLLSLWLAPSPAGDFEIGAEVAHAGQAKKKTSSKAAKRPPAKGTPAATRHHHHHNLAHLRAAARALHVARKHVHAVSVNFGNHRHHASQQAGVALHHVHRLEQDIRAAVR